MCVYEGGCMCLCVGVKVCGCVCMREDACVCVCGCVRRCVLAHVYSNTFLFQDIATRPEKFYIGHSDIMGRTEITDILGEGITFEHTWDGTGRVRKHVG